MSEIEPQTTELVTYERDGYIGVITLNRPERRNALSLKVWTALGEAVEKAGEDREARVVLLKGAGKSFCAGLDLSPDNELVGIIMDKPGATQKLRFYREVRRLQEIHTRLEQLNRPTVAVIHGHCLGAGLELVLCCDIRICTADTVFGLPEARLAIITDVGGLQRLPRVVGPGHAREIAFRGHRFDGERARAIGLVNDCFPDHDTLSSHGLEIAREIAANPPLAVQGAKEVYLNDDGVSLDRSLDYNAARSAMIMPSEDIMEAVTAYMEKREGHFKGA
ncbi:MAG: enoyl-CoA hydratase-related protein [Thermodesulfobacteriota bacterium]